jgi:hypothetical protein
MYQFGTDQESLKFAIFYINVFAAFVIRKLLLLLFKFAKTIGKFENLENAIE